MEDYSLLIIPKLCVVKIQFRMAFRMGVINTYVIQNEFKFLNNVVKYVILEYFVRFYYAVVI